MNIDVRGLKLMRSSELESCFESAPAAEMASGVYRGGALVLSGTRIGHAVNALLPLIWQGKNIHLDSSCIYNRVTPFGFSLLRGALSHGLGVDGRPSTIISYPILGAGDEVRQVGAKTFLGRGTRNGRYIVYFYLGYES